MPSRQQSHLIVLAFALCIPAGLNLLQYWLHNPLYGYGIWVPFLAAYLFWQRRAALGKAEQPVSPFLAVAVVSLYLLSWPVLRVVQVANPDWRLVDLILSLGMVASLLALFYCVGGRRLLADFWLPACFLLTTVPWSTSAEQSFVAYAIPLTGRATSELLWTLGVAVVDSGKTIYTAVGPIQVSEDCSGIRSFHLAIMATFFWIGYFRLQNFRAWSMAATALGMTLALNILRVTVLVLIVVKSNQVALMEHWHDTMGSIAQGLLVIALPTAAWLLGKRLPPFSERREPMPFFIPKWVPIAVLVWCLGVGAFAEGWYRLHESTTTAAKGFWGLNLKSPGINPVENPVPANVKENYFFSEGHNLEWTDANNSQWTILYLDFDQGALSACTHNIHRPEVCLAMSDITLIGQPDPLKVTISDRQLVFTHQIFQRNNHPIHLFHAYLQNLPEENNQADWTYQGRLRAAGLGIRSHRAELIHLMVEAPYSPEHARAAASEYLKQLLVRKTD